MFTMLSENNFDTSEQDKATLAEQKKEAEQDLENIYQTACGLFEEKKYAESLAHFVFLIFQFPYDPRFHFGLAACLQQEKRYEDALSYFANALLMDNGDASAAYGLAACLIALDRLNEAREALQSAIELSYADPAWMPLREQAEKQLRELIR